MRKRITFKFKIIAILLLVMALLGTVGIFAYLRFSEIVLQLSRVSQSDMGLVGAKSLVNEVGESESHAKSYGITRDTAYLRKFYQSVRNAETKLDSLRKLTDTVGITTQQVNQLDSLIHEKFGILEEFLMVHGQFRVQEALDKVVYEIERSSVEVETKVKAEDSVPGNETPEKKNIFSWLFKRRKKITELPPPPPVNENTSVTLRKVNKEVQEIKKEESDIEILLRNKELELIVQDNEVNKKIKQVILDMEQSELEAISLQAEKTAEAVKKTNIKIAVFCVTIVLFLLAMTYLIINYIRFNNKYRRALKKAKEKTEELSVAKERFLANISHEIRTPMNAIAGFTEQIAQGPLTKEQSEQVDIIRKAIDHMLYLVNDTLDISKLQAGKLKLEKTGFYPLQLINESLAVIKPLAADKELIFSVSMHVNNETVIIGDPFRLRQILINILSNAVKFTKSGSIDISVDAVSADDKHTLLKVKVSDTGIGMNKQQLSRVFREFEQGHPDTTRNYGGTGLGLSIVNLLVKLHGGEIQLSSVPRKGTTVSINLPYETGKASDVANAEEDMSPEQYFLQPGMRILVVDDEEFNRKLLVTILKKRNIICTEAINGKEALKELKKNNFDLVLMDARMPVMGGIETISKIREITNPEKNSVPVIVLTAAVDFTEREAYMQSDIQGFLAKPFRERELIQEIVHVLQHENQLASIPVPEMTIEEETVSAGNKTDFSDLKLLSNGDTKFYREMLATFLKSTRSGLDAISLALNSSNYAAIAEHAHRISSPCKHLSANELYELLKKTEEICRSGNGLNEVDELYLQAVKEFDVISAEVEAELNHDQFDNK